MIFGRKKRQIAELQKQLNHALNNLAVARVVSGVIDGVNFGTDLRVEKGKWYRVSYMFKHDGGPVLSVAALVVEDVTRERGESSYFDGGSHEQEVSSWTGTPGPA